MKDEYIIINKTAIQKRIEELDEIAIEEGYAGSTFSAELKKILSQSTPFIPVVKKAYRAGYCYSQYHEYNEKGEIQIESEEDYISNLKLDI